MRPPASLSAVAIDLTPVLPGGENGGAKVFALELVRGLAALAPATEFILLTQAASHHELATLDRANVRRVMVVGPAAAQARSRIFALASRVLAAFPPAVRRGFARLGYAAHGRLKRAAAEQALRGARWDLLFCPFTAPTFHRAGIPTVCTLYDLQFRDHPDFFSPEDAEQRQRAFHDACRHATFLAAISEFTRRAAIEFVGLEPARIRTIPLRLTPSPAGRDTRACDRLGLMAGGFLLYPANFWKHKNHAALVEAFAIACRGELPAAMKLVCTGESGAGRSAAVEAVARAGLGERVLFPGYLADEDLAALMRDCAGIVFPSLYEGFGLPVVEAMALGIPVACSDRTALSEVAGDATLFFDPRSTTDIARAIVTLATDAGLRSRLVDAGRRQAAKYAGPERMAMDYLELFRQATVPHG